MLYNQNNLNVAKFASTSDIRPELAGVLFTKSKTVATDAVRLIEVSTHAKLDVTKIPQAMQGFKPFIVNAKQLREVKLPHNKSIAELDTLAVKFRDDSKVELMTADKDGNQNVRVLRSIAGEFPDYEKIFPTGAPVAEITINGEMIAELFATLAKIGNLSMVTLKLYGKTKPVVLEAGNEQQKGRAMIMGMNN